MNLRSQQFLLKLANLQRHEATAFSHNTVKKHIKELKYLASQKHVPKLTIRKQIIHLEQQLSGVKDLELQLQRQRKHESVKVASLKREITRLRKELQLAHNPQIKKKVQKLSHLLSENLAQNVTKEAVKQVKNKLQVPIKKPISTQIRPSALLLTRIQALKHELELQKTLGKDEDKIELLKKQLHFIESKLSGNQVPPPIIVRPPVIQSSSDKHKIIFHPNVKPNTLPVPPQPSK
ncbi:hypothetical protein HOI26_04345 [Candidatus Woesearchaeota archaeon]|jgi:hypothetical protein|nr:hypothetical protein [Candidatus Woesearchaeota archaeon]MBT5740305.1 hypothetical protein [Candidatus Woesearchaeota archaeon]